MDDLELDDVPIEIRPDKLRDFRDRRIEPVVPGEPNNREQLIADAMLDERGPV